MTDKIHADISPQRDVEQPEGNLALDQISVAREITTKQPSVTTEKKVTEFKEDLRKTNFTFPEVKKSEIEANSRLRPAAQLLAQLKSDQNTAGMTNFAASHIQGSEFPAAKSNTILDRLVNFIAKLLQKLDRAFFKSLTKRLRKQTEQEDEQFEELNKLSMAKTFDQDLLKKVRRKKKQKERVEIKKRAAQVPKFE